ncbi:MAG: hypothetical protein RRY78_00355 [Clostridia bacterium]
MNVFLYCISAVQKPSEFVSNSYMIILLFLVLTLIFVIVNMAFSKKFKIKNKEDFEEKKFGSYNIIKIKDREIEKINIDTKNNDVDIKKNNEDIEKNNVRYNHG